MCEATIGHQRDSTYLKVVFPDELNMADEGAEVLPTRKLAQVYDETLQRAMRLDPGIDHQRDRVEVLRAERAHRLDDEDAGLPDERGAPRRAS